jgi:hypothetical protein
MLGETMEELLPVREVTESPYIIVNCIITDFTWVTGFQKI